jgi:hypothetical protein
MKITRHIQQGGITGGVVDVGVEQHGGGLPLWVKWVVAFSTIISAVTAVVLGIY